MQGTDASTPEYFRTRHSCMTRLGEIAADTIGNLLLAFDFPFGYPAGAGLGGGRGAAKKISALMTDTQNGPNNRFDVASDLNKILSTTEGPFWGHPKSQTYPHLSWSKPPFHHDGFNEWRLSEKHLKSQGHRIMNVWQLMGQGSVGSQTLTGLNRLYDFAENLSPQKTVRFWPFETNWDETLGGIILAEVWPSLSDFSAMDHSIKDARQVKACAGWLAAKNKDGDIRSLFSKPACLSKEDQGKCLTEEGWILGVR